MNEQPLIIKNGMIQLKLDRTTEVIVEIPEKYKDRILLDMWTKSELKVFNTLTQKPELFMVKEFKGWTLDKETNRLRLINNTKFIKEKR